MAKYLSLCYWTTPQQLVTVDLETGVGRLATYQGGRGGLGKAAVWLSERGVLLLANADKGYLSEYTPATGVMRTIGPCPDRDFYASCISLDGRVFWGTYPNAHVVEYNPATDEIIDHGSADPSFDGPHYGYYIGVDPACTHVYLGLGHLPWYLAVLDLATGEYTLHFKDEGDVNSGIGTAADRSAVWYVRHKLNGTTQRYTLSGGALTPTDDPSPPALPYAYHSGVDYSVSEWQARHNVIINLNEATSTTSKPNPIVRWKAPEDEGWQEAVIDAPALKDVVIKRVYPYDATRLLCLSAEYGPVYLYTPATGNIEQLGFPQYSLYDARKIGSKWYLNGYTAATLEWDPAQPWSLVTSSPDQTITNPRKVLSVHKYHHYSVEYNGVLYVAVNHLRDSVGGDIGWYDPQTGENGHLREGFEVWGATGLAVCGDVLVYGGESIEGNDAQLIVFDPATKSIVDRITPLPGEAFAEAGWLIAAGGDVIGITGNRAYRVTVATGARVWAVTLPGAAFGTSATADQRAEISPVDGMIYLYSGDAIYKLNPADGTIFRVLGDSTPGAIMWHGNAAYIYGTTNLRRLVLPE